MSSKLKIEPAFSKAKKTDANILKKLIQEYYQFDNQSVSEEKIDSSLSFALEDNPYVSIWLIDIADTIAAVSYTHLTLPTNREV